MAADDNWCTLREFTTARFTLKLQWAWEDYPDLSWDETGETRAKCESGEWGIYCFRGVAYCDEREVASDYLGNSIYAAPIEFSREHVGARGQHGSYFADMVTNVISETRKALCNVPRLRCA